jgi:drug/metabolite transporter (DMT)-like permease
MLLQPAQKNISKGILYLVLSSFCFALMGMLVHLSGTVPFIQKTFFRNVVAFLIALGILIKDCIKNHTRVTVPHGSLRYLFLRSAAGSLGIFGNFYALDRINISDASILNKMSPFFAVIFSFFLLGEKIDAVPLLAICGALGGAMLVVKPTFDFSAALPSLAGFIGGIGAGFAYACVRKMSTLKVNGSVIVTFFSAFSCLLSVPFLIAHFSPMTVRQLLILIGAGIAAAGGQFGITAAYYSAPASKISIFDYSQILFSSLMGYFAFGQIPDTLSLCGYTVIVSMAVIVFIYNRKKTAD